MLKFDSVSKQFDGHVALQSVELDLAERSTTAIIGPSGCGKSTLLRMVVGLVEPDQGSVTFKNAELARLDQLQLRRRLGYVIQEGGLFPHLTAEGNIALMTHYLRWDESRISERMRELLELVQLDRELLQRYPDELSGGQRQRVSIMRALMLDPELLLLDEPFAALDPLIRYYLQQDMKRIFERLHKTVVLVTHDMAEAAFLADRIVLMKDGNIVQEGILADLLERPCHPFVDEFIRAQRSVISERGGRRS